MPNPYRPPKSLYSEAEEMDWESVEEFLFSKNNYPGYTTSRGVFIHDKTQVEEFKDFIEAKKF